MTRRMLPHVSVFVLLVFLISPISRAEQLAAKYLLIRRHSIFFGEDDLPSRALLITDPDAYTDEIVHEFRACRPPVGAKRR